MRKLVIERGNAGSLMERFIALARLLYASLIAIPDQPSRKNSGKTANDIVLMDLQ
jgi:hypothetical protein